MTPQQHRYKADRILRSLEKCDISDYEMIIEGAMLAGGHLFNAALHEMGFFPPSRDVLHMAKLSLEDYWRLRALAPTLVNSFFEIEELRSPYVRGAEPDGEVGARLALALLEAVKLASCNVKPHGMLLPPDHPGSNEWREANGWD